MPGIGCQLTEPDTLDEKNHSPDAKIAGLVHQRYSKAKARQHVTTHCKAPMHAKMDRNKHVVVGEEIHLFRPAPDCLVTARQHLWIEERVEAVNFRHIVLAATFYQQVHVEVDDLKTQCPVISNIINLNGIGL